jgi:hypothetical protein
VRYLSIVIVFLTTVTFAQPRPTPTRKRPDQKPLTPRFVIGVYMQPPDTFDVWKTRGINTLVGYESRGGAISNHDWSEAAAAKGFHFFRKPGDPVADVKDDYLLAWMHDDEPDVRKPPTDPEKLAADYAQWKTAGDKPVFVNFSGGYVLGGKVPKEQYQAYMKAADWIGNDFYPVTGYNRPDWLWKIGAAVDQLRDWSGGKPQLAFIESSPQRLSWTPKSTRGVTPDELRAEIWHAVIHGVRGIVYFPQQIGEGFRYDATQQNVALEMVRQNKRLAELQDMLATPMNPNEAQVSANKPLEIGWRMHEGKLYVIALNFIDAPTRGATITIKDATGVAKVVGDDRTLELKNGSITDNFLPFGVHIYVR